MTSISDERAKYRAVWSHRDYGAQADGEPMVERAWEGVGCHPGQSLIDWGCGCGRPAQMFQDRGLEVTGFDIAGNCLDHDINVPLVVGTLWDPPQNLFSDYAFCTDVLEHIPPEHLLDTLNVLVHRTLKAGFFQVDTFPDLYGPRMIPPRQLHLSLHSREWWLREFRARWPKVDMIQGSFTRWAYLCRKW